jgi:hypothetical protein
MIEAKLMLMCSNIHLSDSTSCALEFKNWETIEGSLVKNNGQYFIYKNIVLIQVP